MRAILTTLLWLTACSVALSADIPPLNNFHAHIAAPAHIWVTPDGSGLALTDAYAQDGSGQMDATITVTLLDWNDDPIYNFPREDVWIECLSSLSFQRCLGGTTADTDSDINGEMLFYSPFQAGGGTGPAESINVVVNGDTLPELEVNLTINSPDMNGDLAINLSDISYFIQALMGDYDWQADFNNDGFVNLSDVTVMAGSIGQTCP